jgi:hypothetical protein
MAQVDFSYSTAANDAAGLPLTVSVFADRAHLRATMQEDAANAGFRVTDSGAFAQLLEGDARALGEVVLVDCPQADGAALAALSRLDMRAANCGAHLIVSTSIAAIDDVFACLDQSGAQILVEPGRADRVIALGQVLSRYPNMRVRELTEDDRLMLLRLTEQVGQIAQQVERLNQAHELDPDEARREGLFRFEAPRQHFNAAQDDANKALVRAPRPPLPEPRLIRRILRQRQLRGQFFDAGLFADPAWDMLLDLTAARAEHKRVSVSSLCIASGVPPTTALRWIGQMTEAGLFERVEDEADRRRAFIALSDAAADAMARYFAELGRGASRLV